MSTNNRTEESLRRTRARSATPAIRRRQPYLRLPQTQLYEPSRHQLDATHEDDAHSELIAQTDFRIFDLPRPFETPPDIVLPAKDDYGWPTADGYSALLEARSPSLATRATLRDFKFCRRHEALSMGEFAIQLALKFNPYVVDLREQYGIYDPAHFQRANSAGKRMLRAHLMTIDIVVTYVLPGVAGLRYHGISVKDAGYMPAEKDRRRELKERARMAERGWTWELVRQDAVSRLEVENYVFLSTLVRSTAVSKLYASARVFAHDLMRCGTRGSMDAVIKRAARRSAIGLDDAYRMFATGVAYGFLTLDHTHPLNRHLPLYLVKGPASTSPLLRGTSTMVPA